MLFIVVWESPYTQLDRTTADRYRGVMLSDPFAAVLAVGKNLGIAISTDGVGSKLYVAEKLDKYDTLGIDCVAMNVNDVLCVGAKPISMVDYISLKSEDISRLPDLIKGLVEGAKLAGISISGGETSQIDSFDMVGTCIGTVELDKVITGSRIECGDALIGYESSGIHSNGISTALNVLSLAGYGINKYIPELERTLGEELLTPTTIYTDVVADLREKVDVRGMVHITGGGMMNLLRTGSGYDIQHLPRWPAIFDIIYHIGEVSLVDMYKIFNMGIGLCVVVPHNDIIDALKVGPVNNMNSWYLGHVSNNKRLLIGSTYL